MGKHIELYNNNKFGFFFIDVVISKRIAICISFGRGFIIEMDFFFIDISLGYVK